MRTKHYAAFTLCSVVAVGIISGSIWKSFENPALAQATKSLANSPEKGQWIRLNDASVNPSFPIWVNLERADSILFYTGSYETRKNVPQATVTLSGDMIPVNDPHDIAVLRRYVQSHQLSN